MKHIHFLNVEPHLVEGQDVKGVTMRVGITDSDGAPHFAMRLFQVQPNGYTPLHRHPWEHEVFVISGSGQLNYNDEEHSLQKGDFVLIEADALHQFKNIGPDEFQFICVIPHQSLLGKH
ncbi:cupin domain-containing protein [bacterium]|nr:cupin domain-containing protein [bacterium]